MILDGQQGFEKAARSGRAAADITIVDITIVEEVKYRFRTTVI